MAEIKIISPAYNRANIDGPISLEELPWCGKIILRGNPQNRQLIKNVESVFGLKLPVESNTCIQDKTHQIFWLGPNEWIVYCELAETQNKIASLKSALSELHSAIVDVSDYYTILRLSGPESTRLITKACPLDLHPDKFPKGSCTQTRFGHAGILLHKFSDTPGYDIQIRWSYTEYVWDYLKSGINTL